MTGLEREPKRDVIWVSSTKQELRAFPKRVRTLIGRGIEVAQWGQTDSRARPMKGPLREVFEIVIEGDRLTHRAAYYVTKDVDGPIAVLDVFVKKSTSGVATPKPILDRIRTRLKHIKEIEYQRDQE